jgi:hypothetical protein
MTITKVDTSTKAAVGLDPVTTHITIDWTGMTEDDLRALAQQTLIIKFQAAFRRNKEGIPKEYTARAVDHKVGMRVAKQEVNLDKLLGKLTAEQKLALAERLLEGGE